GASEPGDRAAAEIRNLVDVAEAIAVSARFREESRGGHFRRDFPSPDDARFRGHTLLDAAGPRLPPLGSPAHLGTPCCTGWPFSLSGSTGGSTRPSPPSSSSSSWWTSASSTARRTACPSARPRPGPSSG